MSHKKKPRGRADWRRGLIRLRSLSPLKGPSGPLNRQKNEEPGPVPELRLSLKARPPVSPAQDRKPRAGLLLPSAGHTLRPRLLANLGRLRP
ncbi:MAG TPA: hypothetical protein VN829_20765 [Dongiaceae bacterium]|nr:hypothetical protein [Dongiaceae bacterium]